MTDDEFAEAYQRYNRRLVNRVYSRLPEGRKCRMLAEDLAQDAWLKAYRHAASRQTGNAFWYWLVRVAINLTHDYLRRPDLLYWEEFDPYNLTPGPVDVERQVERGEHQRALGAAIDRLAPRSALVLHAQYDEGWGPKQIANATGWTIRAVKALRHRGLNGLRRSLTQGNR